MTRAILTLYLATLVAVCVVSTARAHPVPATKTEINGGLQGRLHHLTRVLAQRNGAIRYIRRHRQLYHGHAGDAYWHFYRERARTTRTLTHVRRLLARVARPPHYNQWLCIHHYEGSWTDPGAPYWGGLQFDYDFMRTYGPHLLATKGTADNWTPLEQMWVAERAWRTRGFQPWPQTARLCGLL